MGWLSCCCYGYCRCGSISDKYDYRVEYSGVGNPPPHKQHVGHCSQLATFTRTDVTMATDAREVCLSSPYKMVGVTQD